MRLKHIQVYRFENVVVGSRIEAADDILLSPSDSGDHENRHAREHANSATYVPAIHEGKFDIENYEIRALRLCLMNSFRASVGALNFEARSRKISADEFMCI